MEPQSLALFPIPGSVTFPSVPVPLHVFEPRYRKMIGDALEFDLWVGVAHTKKVLVERKPTVKGDDPASVLNSNLSTYEAEKVFSAGPVELLQETADGRLLVQVKMQARFEWVEEIQQVPYKMVRAIPYEDEPVSSETLNFQRAEFIRYLRELRSETLAPLNELLTKPEWTSKTATDFSLALFSIFAFDPETSQKIIEMKSCADRYRLLREVLEPLRSPPH